MTHEKALSSLVLSPHLHTNIAKLPTHELEETIKMVTCFFCDESEDIAQCSICNIVHYCSLHESVHKRRDTGTCYPWSVETRPGVGRMIVATRDIACHEIVLEDEPQAVSPTQVWLSLLLDDHYTSLHVTGLSTVMFVMFQNP